MNTQYPEGSFYTVYQPIIDLRTDNKKIVGYEALSRFENGDSPEEVFKKAWLSSDEEGIELEVEAASLALKQFKPRGSNIYLSINVSVKTIIDDKKRLIQLIESTADKDSLGLGPSCIVLEITEHSAVTESDYQRLYEPLLSLRRNKVRTAIDDVGKGASGLWQGLQILPDIFKIDKDLIHGLGTSVPRQGMVGAIVHFASVVRSNVVAEGIETQEQIEWCKIIGVDYGQGIFFGTPQPFEASAG